MAVKNYSFIRRTDVSPNGDPNLTPSFSIPAAALTLDQPFVAGVLAAFSFDSEDELLRTLPVAAPPVDGGFSIRTGGGSVRGVLNPLGAAPINHYLGLDNAVPAPGAAYGADEQTVLTNFYANANVGPLVQNPSYGTAPKAYELALVAVHVTDGDVRVSINGVLATFSADSYIAIGEDIVIAPDCNDSYLCGAFIHQGTLGGTLRTLMLAIRDAKFITGTRGYTEPGIAEFTPDYIWNVKDLRGGDTSWVSSGGAATPITAVTTDGGPTLDNHLISVDDMAWKSV